MGTELAALPTGKIAEIVEQNRIAPTNSRELIQTFEPFFVQADQLCAQASRVKVTDATQLTEMKQSRELRLQLKATFIEGMLADI